MLSPEGRCKTLDASADGYVRAEACGIFLLQADEALPRKGGRLFSSNESDTDRPQFMALLVGSAVNQDGRSSSLTAPNGPAQQRVIREALRGILGPDANLSSSSPTLTALCPSDIVALSMHGTGTPLGDPIEVGAAAAVLLPPAMGDPDAIREPVTFLSSKSWLGHAEPAAGV